MKLRSLAVNQFKKFTAPTRLDGLQDGLNVVVGPNEMGKSTLLDALRAVLFERHDSKAQPIMALQNDRSQSAPGVELEFDLDDGRYVIAKRFVKRPRARLTRPDGAALDGEAAEEMLRELLGFDKAGIRGAVPETLRMWGVLWVQQGQSIGGLALAGSARSSLDGVLDSEVGAVLGGRRGRALPQAIETQLYELVTPKTKRPTGNYKQAISECESLQTELDALRGRRQQLAQALNDLDTARESLKRLDEGGHDAADRQELEETRRRHHQLAGLEAEIAAAQAERERRDRMLTEAKQALAARQTLKDEIAADTAALATLDCRLADCRRREQEARTGLEGLRNDRRRAEDAAAKADESVGRHRRIVTAVERRARIEDLERHHRDAGAAEARRQAALRDAAAILVTDDSIALLRKAAGTLESVNNRLAAGATLIAFDMTPEGLSGIEIDGEAMRPAPAPLRVVEPTCITIPERGRITIEPAIRDRNRLLRQRRDLEAELRRGLAEAGADGLADAEEQFVRRQALLQQAALARKETELYAPATEQREAGAAALRLHIDGLQQTLNRELETLGLTDLPGIADAESALQASQDRAEAARSVQAGARAALEGPEREAASLSDELAGLRGQSEERRAHLDRRQDQLARATADQPDAALDAAIEAAQAALVEQDAAIAALKGRRGDEGLGQLEARLTRLEQVIENRRKRRDELRTDIARLESHIQTVEGEGLDEKIAETERQSELCETERSRLEREVRILQLLLSTLRGAEQEARDRYLSPVLRRIQPYLQYLFPDSRIVIDTDFKVTGVVRQEGYEETFDRLSMGTQEQIAILVRLAFAQMLVERGQPATVILDDALVFSDDARIRRMFDILTQAAGSVQIIILTCREQIFEQLGGHRLRLTEAAPEDLLKP